jgi:hypothetical protein
VTEPHHSPRASVLLICSAQTDARAWAPVVARLGADSVDVEVIDWPREPRSDVVATVDALIGPETLYDLAVGAGQGVDGAVEAARRGAARRLVLIGPSGGLAMTEVDVDLDFEVEAMMAGLSPAMEQIVEALQTGDLKTFARLSADQIGHQIGPEHRDVVEEMLLEHSAALSGDDAYLPAYHPWADWLRELETPVVLVFNEQTAVEGSVAQRHAVALLARCQNGKAVTLPYQEAGYAGLSHPEDIVAIIMDALG